MLMGASLPAASRWLESTPEGISWMGLLYGANTAGAVLGCLLAGFYLLRFADMTTATLCAAAINIAVAMMSLALARRTGQPHRRRRPPPATGKGYWPVYVTIAISGACALGAEVVWTRLLGLLLGATVYTFSIILAVFLVGLGIGSAARRAVSRRRPAAPGSGLLPSCCWLAAIAWTAFHVSPIAAVLAGQPAAVHRPWATRSRSTWCASIWAILPATLLWGASFPLALAAAAAPGEDPGRMVGGSLRRQHRRRDRRRALASAWF